MFNFYKNIRNWFASKKNDRINTPMPALRKKLEPGGNQMENKKKQLIWFFLMLKYGN